MLSFLGVRPVWVRILGGSGARRRSSRVKGSGPLKQFPLRRDVGRFLREKSHNPGIDRLGHLRQVLGAFVSAFRLSGHPPHRTKRPL